MALTLTQSGIATSAMASSSYWPDTNASSFASSGNSGGGGALGSTAFHISSSPSSGSNTNTTYNASQSSQPSHSYPAYDQQEEMPYPSHIQNHYVHRPSSGIGTGGRQLTATSSPPLSSSLHYSARPHAHQSFLPSFSANPGSISLSSPLSSGSSVSSSLVPSLASSSISLNSYPSSSLSPLSPNIHQRSQVQQTQNPRDRLNVHPHAYPTSLSGSGTTNQNPPPSVDSSSNKNDYSARITAAHAQMLYSFDSSEASNFDYEQEYSRNERANMLAFPRFPIRIDTHSGSDHAMEYSTTSPNTQTRPTAAYTHTPSQSTNGRGYHYTATDENQNRARLRTRAGARVKAEPDLEESRLEHSPELTGDGEGGGARFVMEHPYPYSYSTTPRRARDRSNLGTTSPSPPPTSGDNERPSNRSPFRPPSAGVTSQQQNHDLQQQQMSQPHSLTAPLRAVNASAEMRERMGVFRLDPFAQLNGVALRCGFVTSFEKGIFPNGKNKRKNKGKGRKGKKKKRGAGKKSRKHAEASQEDDSCSDIADDMDDNEWLDDNAPAWDGLPAGPLEEEPALIEFQVYFDGMEVEGDGGGALTVARAAVASPDIREDESDNGRVANDEDTTQWYARQHAYHNSATSATIGSITARGSKGESRTIDATHSSRCTDNVEYANNITIASSVGRGPEYDRRTEGRNAHTHVRQTRGGEGAMFGEYLHLDLDDIDVEVDRWGSGEASPTTPYHLTRSQNEGKHPSSFMETKIPAERTGSIPTCVNAVAAVSGSSSSMNANSVSSVPQATTTTIANGAEPIRARYIDSAGYLRFSDSTHISSSSFGQSTPPAPISALTEHNSDSGASPSPSPFYDLAASEVGTGAGNNSANLQQLRTQAALRAVSAHASQTQSQTVHGLYRGAPEASSGSLQRPGMVGTGGGSGGAAGTGTVNFTPTPASLAAEMHAGSLANGRLGMNHQHNRMRSSSLAYPSSHTSQGQGHTGASYDSYSQSQQMISNSQQAPSSASYSSSGCAYTDYLTTAESDNGSGAFDHNHAGSNLQELERRWSDVSQRVHG